MKPIIWLAAIRICPDLIKTEMKRNERQHCRIQNRKLKKRTCMWIWREFTSANGSIHSANGCQMQKISGNKAKRFVCEVKFAISHVNYIRVKQRLVPLPLPISIYASIHIVMYHVVGVHAWRHANMRNSLSAESVKCDGISLSLCRTNTTRTAADFSLSRKNMNE